MLQKMQSKASGESLCFAQKAKNHTEDQSKDHPKGERNMRGRGRRNFRGRGGRNNSRKRSKCKCCGKTGHTSDQCWASWDSIKDKHNQKKDEMLVNFLILVLLHIVILDLMK